LDQIWTLDATGSTYYAGVSEAGLFRSTDGGKTWHSKNESVPAAIEDKNLREIGYCVHALA